MEPVTSEAFSKTAQKVARQAVETGEPITVTYHRKPYVRVVSNDWFERAAAALSEKESAASAA